MSIIQTQLDRLVADYPNGLDQWNLRLEDYGLTRKALMNTANPTGIISNDVIEKAQNSYARGLDIPVMSTSKGTLGNGLSCTSSGVEAISDMVGVIWTRVSADWTMEPSKNETNHISYQQELARKTMDNMDLIYENIEEAIDTNLIANLAPEAQYTNSYIGAGNKYGALVANRVQVTLAQRDRILNDWTSISKSDSIRGRLDVIGSTNMESIIRDLNAQGISNDTNDAFQIGLFDFMFSNNVTVGANSDATAYVVPKGSFGILFRNGKDPLANRRTTKGHIYGTLFDDKLDTLVDTLFVSDCADISAISGEALDDANVKEFHQVAVTYGLLVPYRSGAQAKGGVIRGFDMLTA
jgi:hypothetical protein